MHAFTKFSEMNRRFNLSKVSKMIKVTCPKLVSLLTMRLNFIADKAVIKTSKITLSHSTNEFFDIVNVTKHI